MTTLVGFLMARLDEDEVVARAAINPERPGSHWQWVDSDTDRVVTHLAAEDDLVDLSLRSVEEYPSHTIAANLPAFVLNHAEADDPRALPHIARHDPARVLREVAAKRAILEFHEQWPVLVESPPEFEQSGADVASMAFRMSQKIAWLTQREYVARFGKEPPTTPMLRAMAAVYSDHPDYREEWR